jgi:UDP-N-acetylglucosamine 2-epimerase (non-hydrolysing)
MTVLSVIGTRPEAIKMAPVIAELAKHAGAVRSLTCVTGQHREMLQPILGLFGIRADYDLEIMRPSQSLALLTAALFTSLDRVMLEAKPDWVLAQGDTTTVLAASVTAYYHQIRFGHVEAGLRTGDKLQPFPEELNRTIADVVAEAHFAPTERARECLLREGHAPEKIHVTGNTVVDALLEIEARPFAWEASSFATLPKGKRLVMVTAHRRENFGQPLREICQAIRDLAIRYVNSVQFLFPVHLNPNAREPVHEILEGLANVTLTEPVDYQLMVQLMKRAELILTDSGGLQEEAATLGVPVLLMRSVTERPEGVDAGLVRLVGTDRALILAEATRVLDGAPALRGRPIRSGPYGDGKAATRIVSILLEGAKIATQSNRAVGAVGAVDDKGLP